LCVSAVIQSHCAGLESMNRMLILRAR
jgi:hypothetical protein